MKIDSMYERAEPILPALTYMKFIELLRDDRWILISNKEDTSVVSVCYVPEHGVMISHIYRGNLLSPHYGHLGEQTLCFANCHETFKEAWKQMHIYDLSQFRSIRDDEVDKVTQDAIETAKRERHKMPYEVRKEIEKVLDMYLNSQN